MKKVSILGSTGSIGTQALSIIEENPEKFEVTAVSCANSINLLSEQIRKFNPKYAVISNKDDASKLQAEFHQTKILFGDESLNFIASETDCDIVLNSLVGIKGLEPTYKAVLAGKDIALANKETLVAGGELITKTVSEKGVRLLPVDSEHSAIFQCLEGNETRQVNRIILTASGGPFRGMNRKQLEEVTIEQALNHPKWKMGKKITIDSATLMNKGLEVIEAGWLFGMPAEKIDVVIHPQSIIHSMVEYSDHAVLAQLGSPDMKIPISLALEYPQRLANNLKPLDFSEIGNLTFEKPDLNTFKCLSYAFEAFKAGGSYPVAMNAANEVLTSLFLDKKISFLDITDGIGKILDSHKPHSVLSLDTILSVDRETRDLTMKLLILL